MNIGDYVIIKTLSGQGRIAKLKKVDDICITDNGAVDKNNIIKSSPNIIDLIEVGDYVNGYKIIHKGFDNDKEDLLFIEWQEDKNQKGGCALEKEDIKSIVTREQFSQMEYKVGD